MSYCNKDTYANGRQKIKRTKRLYETTKERHLSWIDYYSSRNFGIWIECTKCKKWRRCFQYIESHEVPEIWYCSMNITEDGKHGSCDDPEENTDEDFIEYCPGSIVWAKLDGYPWWPGIVDEEPDIEEFYWKTRKHTFYNVTFLDEHVSRAWVMATQICPFLKPPRKHQLFTTTFKKHKYIPLLNKAEERANEALKMTLKDRLKRFSFANLYKGKWPHARDLNVKEAVSSEDITDALIKEIEELDCLNSDDTDVGENHKDEEPIGGTNPQKSSKSSTFDSNLTNFITSSPKITLEAQKVNGYSTNNFDKLQGLKRSLSTNFTSDKNSKSKNLTDNKKHEVNAFNYTKDNKYDASNSSNFETKSNFDQSNGNLCIEDEDTLQLDITNDTNEDKRNESISQTIEEVITESLNYKDSNMCQISFMNNPCIDNTKKAVIESSEKCFEKKQSKKRKAEMSKTDFTKNKVQTNNCNESSNESVGLKRNKSLSCDVKNKIKKLKSIQKSEGSESEKSTNNDIKCLKPITTPHKKTKDFIESTDNCEKAQKLKSLDKPFNLPLEEDPELFKQISERKIEGVNSNKGVNKSLVTKNKKKIINKSNSTVKPLFKTFKQPLKENSSSKLNEKEFPNNAEENSKAEIPKNCDSFNGCEKISTYEQNQSEELVSLDVNKQNYDMVKCVENGLNKIDAQSIISTKNKKNYSEETITPIIRKSPRKSAFNAAASKQSSSVVKPHLIPNAKVNGSVKNVTSKSSKLKTAKLMKTKKKKIASPKETMGIDENFESKNESKTISNLGENCFVISLSDEEL